MSAKFLFYLCPICFQADDSPRNCHDHPMIRCDAGGPNDERRKPLTDEQGHVKSHAPRWFLEAVGWMPA